MAVIFCGSFIGTTSDVDMFKFTVQSADTFNFNVTVPQFGDLDSQLYLYRVTKLTPFAYKYQTVAFADPSISSIQPFQGLGASVSAYLQPGTYALAVKSHGSFGDLGNYTLSGNHGGIVINDLPVLTVSSAGAGESNTSLPEAVSLTNTTKQSRLAGGQGSTPSLVSFGTEKPAPSHGSNRMDSYTQAVDSIFESWGSKLPRHLS